MGGPRGRENMSPNPKNKGIPCYFIQTGIGNVVMRLRNPETGSGTPLTLHQVVTLNVPITTIPFFDPEKFKKFYGDKERERQFLDHLFQHNEPEESFLKYGPGMKP